MAEPVWDILGLTWEDFLFNRARGEFTSSHNNPYELFDRNKTVIEFLTRTEDELLKTPKLGNAALKMLRTGMERFGFQLGQFAAYKHEITSPSFDLEVFITKIKDGLQPIGVNFNLSADIAYVTLPVSIPLSLVQGLTPEALEDLFESDAVQEVLAKNAQALRSSVVEVVRDHQNHEL